MSEAPLVDPKRLHDHLTHALGPIGPAGAFRAERHQAGHSNETFFVDWGHRRLVLRRPPRGAFLPTAHDVVREHTVISALAGRGVRVPRPVAACTDPAVLGAPFYLMERVEGEVIRFKVPAALDTPAGRRGIGHELVDALVELHAVDWATALPDGFARPDGYLERQVRRWSGQLELTQPKTRASRDVPALREVAAWLSQNVPASPPATVVHGDYKLDNVAFAPEAPARLLAVYDWEMATVGDPLADVGWMLSFWHDPEAQHEDVLTLLQGVTAAPGFPTRAQMVARYEERSGRAVTALPFYLALAHWKLAILLEGSYARHLEGHTDDPFFALMEEGVPALAARALGITARAAPARR